MQIETTNMIIPRAGKSAMKQVLQSIIDRQKESLV